MISSPDTPTLRLRALEPEDLELVYRIENDPTFWRHGSTTVPYSRYTLRQFIADSTGDIFRDGQVRLVIEIKEESGARDSLPLHGLHTAKGAPRPPGIGGWLLAVDCWTLPTRQKSCS